MTQITRYRGDTKRIVRQLKDATGTPVNITSWSFTMTINRHENPIDTAEQVAQITGAIDSATDGTFHFPMTGVTVPVGKYYFDVQATDQNSEIETIEKGRFVVEQDITK